MKMVDYVRESSRGRILEKAISTGVDFSYTVEAIPGKTQLINLLVKNPFPKQSLFKVYFEDSEGYEFSHELNLVHNRFKEWEYWVNNGSSTTKATRPNNYDIVSEYNDFILEPF